MNARNRTWGNHCRPSCWAAAGLLILLGAAAAHAQKPPAAPANPFRKIDAKAKALLDQTVKALGGPAFLDFKTLSSRGRIFTISEGQTAGYAPFKSQELYPDHRRFSYGKDQPVVLIYNGDMGWEEDRYGTIPLDSKRIESWKLASRYALVNLLRIVAREKGTLVLTAGEDFVDLQPVEVLEIVDKRGMDVKLYVNRLTHLPVRIAYRMREKPDQPWTEVAEVYSDYQTFQGIPTPMHITRYEDGSRTLEVFRSSATYNEDYPPSTFQP